MGAVGSALVAGLNLAGDGVEVDQGDVPLLVPFLAPEVGEGDGGGVAVHVADVEGHVVAGDAEAGPVVGDVHGWPAGGVVEAGRGELGFLGPGVVPGGV